MNVSRFLDLFSTKRGSRFRSNFIHAARGNLIAQALPLVAMPLLTRLYSPDDFAAWAMFLAALGLLTSVGGWRVDWVVPNATSRQQALALMLLGSGVLIAVSLITVLVLWFKPHFLDKWNGARILGPLILLLPVALLGTVIQQLLQSWFVREADLWPTSQGRISQSVANTALSLAGGGFGLGPLGLIGSTVISAWIGIGTLLRHSIQHLRLARRLTIRRMAMSAKRFAKQATWSTAVSLFNVASREMMPILLIQYFQAKEVGWYVLMYRLAVAPIGLVTQGISQSFWAEAADLAKTDTKKLKQLYQRTTKHLFFLSLPIGAVCLLGPFYIGKVFGESKWGEAGYLLAALTPLLMGITIFSPLSVLVVFCKQSWQFVWDLSRVILVVIIIHGMHRIGCGIAKTILACSIMFLLLYLVFYVINLRSFRSLISSQVCRRPDRL
jgi:O-antigen/teichoic acid export membrane protein